MESQEKAVSWRTAATPPVMLGDTELTLYSRSLTIRWPRGGWVWNQPAYVVARRDGQEQRLQVPNITLLAELGVFALSAVFSLMAALFAIRNRRNGERNEN